MGLTKRVSDLEISIKDIDRKKRKVFSTLAEIIPAIEAGIEFEVAPEVEEAFKRITEKAKEKQPKDKAMTESH